MGIEANENAVKLLKQAVAPIANSSDLPIPDIMRLIGDASIVLIGEATHGTQEFYASRAAITKALIEQKGFNLVAIEADWPEVYHINRYVKGQYGSISAAHALLQFERFPNWMWRNTATEEFVGWLKQHNDKLSYKEKVGFYGLDVYSLFASINAVIAYLKKVDPIAAKLAKERYGCFGSFTDPQLYGYHANHNLNNSCLNLVLEQLDDLKHRASRYARDGEEAKEDYLFAEHNAEVIKSAEGYYRAMFKSDALSWNVRDKHMAETVAKLLDYVSQKGVPAKMVIWAHNSHVGDARATQMNEYGELNLGQLLREKHPKDAFIMGYTTYNGTVIAAENWGKEGRVVPLKNALPGSYEAFFHSMNLGDFLLDIKNQRGALSFLRDTLQRAVGVVYRPDTERYSHYLYTDLVDQFDALIHIDQTCAITPIQYHEVNQFEYVEMLE